MFFSNLKNECFSGGLGTLDDLQDSRSYQGLRSFNESAEDETKICLPHLAVEFINTPEICQNPGVHASLDFLLKTQFVLGDVGGVSEEIEASLLVLHSRRSIERIYREVLYI